MFLEEGPQYIASTFVNSRGEIIDHRDDGDDNIYLVDDVGDWDGSKNNMFIVGKERDGVDYNVGDEITIGDLCPNGLKILAAFNGLEANYDFMTREWDIFFLITDVALMISG